MELQKLPSPGGTAEAKFDGERYFHNKHSAGGKAHAELAPPTSAGKLGAAFSSLSGHTKRFGAFTMCTCLLVIGMSIYIVHHREIRFGASGRNRKTGHLNSGPAATSPATTVPPPIGSYACLI